MVKGKGIADLSVAHVNKVCRSVHISDSNLQSRETGVASPPPSKPCINFSWNWNCTVKKLRFSLNKLTKESLYWYQTAKERSKTNLKQKENHTCMPSENYGRFRRSWAHSTLLDINQARSKQSKWITGLKEKLQIRVLSLSKIPFKDKDEI